MILGVFVVYVVMNLVVFFRLCPWCCSVHTSLTLAQLHVRWVEDCKMPRRWTGESKTLLLFFPRQDERDATRRYESLSVWVQKHTYRLYPVTLFHKTVISTENTLLGFAPKSKDRRDPVSDTRRIWCDWISSSWQGFRFFVWCKRSEMVLITGQEFYTSHYDSSRFSCKLSGYIIDQSHWSAHDLLTLVLTRWWSIWIEQDAMAINFSIWRSASDEKLVDRELSLHHLRLLSNEVYVWHPQ